MIHNQNSSISEIYIIIYINKLNIVENIPKNQNKTSMDKGMGPLKDKWAFLLLRAT